MTPRLRTIPLVGVADRIGHQRTILISASLGCAGCFITALAPCFGAGAGTAAIVGLIVFALSKPLFNVSWYPVLGQILLPEERADFFGFMRFSYNIITGGAFFLLGLAMGKNPPLGLLQLVIAAVGLLLLGRGLIVVFLPLPEHQPRRFDLKGALGISIRNAPLTGFSVYAGFMMLAFSPVLPMAMIYLKKGLDLAPDLVQMLSCACIAGSVCGYFVYGRIVKRIGIRAVELTAHGLFILIPLLLLFCGRQVPRVEYLVALLLFLGSFTYASFFCAFSQEILALARPGNATMATAFANTYMQMGMACGRGAAGFLLGCGALSATWTLGGMDCTHFQTIFLICAALGCFGLVLIFCLPSVVPRHEDFYEP